MSKAPHEETLVVSPGPKKGTVLTDDGRKLLVMPNWSWLAAGDATITRRVKKAGASWTVKVRKGRRTISLGLWAPTANIKKVQAEVEAERQTDGYKRRREADARRRAKVQAQYEEEFYGQILAFLGFHSRHKALAEQLARSVTAHAAGIGSGTVARTKRISVERRAEAAVIAWMRHQTTAYDRMRIARVKGRRREVRRKLAEGSRRLLNAYRLDREVDAQACPLQQALRFEQSEREKAAQGDA